MSDFNAAQVLAEAYTLYKKHHDGMGLDFKIAIAQVREESEQRGAEEAIYELTEAIRFTVEYIGNDYLPPIDGWSWFDALRKYRPELAEQFERNPQLQPDSDAIRDVIADQWRYRADRIANKEGDDE